MVTERRITDKNSKEQLGVDNPCQGVPGQGNSNFCTPTGFLEKCSNCEAKMVNDIISLILFENMVTSTTTCLPLPDCRDLGGPGSAPPH